MNTDIEVELEHGKVSPMLQNARFFREGEKDMVEISFVGSKDTTINKVRPEHMAKFRDEWNAYCDGTPMKKRPGTPLTDLPGIDDQKAQQYFVQNVHSVEEIAVLSDAQCQALGHGTLTMRKAAQEMLALRTMRQQERSRDAVVKASAEIGPMPAEKYASESDLAAVKSDMSEIKTMLAQLLAPKKRGPKPKNQQAEG